MGAIQDILDKFLNDSKNIIIDNMRANDQVATGETIEKLKVNSADTGGTLTGAAWIMALETGRKPRQSNKDSGLARKLEQWIVAKSIPIRRSVEQDAKSLAWFINKHGTKLFREGGRKDVITPAINDQRVGKLLKDLGEASTNELKTEIKRVTDDLNN